MALRTVSAAAASDGTAQNADTRPIARALVELRHMFIPLVVTVHPCISNSSPTFGARARRHISQPTTTQVLAIPHTATTVRSEAEARADFPATRSRILTAGLSAGNAVPRLAFTSSAKLSRL